MIIYPVPNTNLGTGGFFKIKYGGEKINDKLKEVKLC